MKCHACTCYVDGHGKNGRKTAKGTGLCTLYDEEVSSDSECKESSVTSTKSPLKNAKETAPKANKAYSQASPDSSEKPKKKRKLLKVFLWLFFLPIMATIAIVKSEKLKKKTKGILLAALWIVFAVVGGTSETTEPTPTPSDSSDPSSVVSTDEKTLPEKEKEAKTVKVKKIADFSTDEYAVYVGDTTELSLKLSPDGIVPESLVIESSDPNVLAISEIETTDEGSKTLLNFVCTAMGEGTATIVVKSAAKEDLTSNAVTFSAEIAPRITAIGRFSPSMAVSEVGDVRTITMPMKPAGLTLEDVEIVSATENIVSIADISIADDGEQSVLTFKITGTGVGTTDITIRSTDGKTTSNELSYRVDEKDTSRKVYVTPHGERYHYSAACAGDNASQTTLNKAVRSGRDGCKKCT